MSALSKVIEHDQMQKITSEFSRLGDRCYLENAGATLFPRSLLQQVNDDLLKNVYSNPHADNYTRDCIDQIRCLVLRHFNTDLDNYTVVFTSGTTQSLKAVVEAFQFANDENEVLNCGSFVYLQDNHTSVIGLRELASAKNADVIHISHEDFLNNLSSDVSTPVNWNNETYKNEGNTLLVYPAQSNFNGFKYPIYCTDTIKEGCLNNYTKKHLCKVNCNWYVLLDAASYIGTNKLDLSRTQPDFVCMSFYKIFGYPTGLGALLIKNDSANVLNQKKYFGGGTVDIVLSSENFHVKRKALHERFEDGTLPFLSVIALKHCFDTMHKLIPKVVSNDIMETVSCHTFYVAKELYRRLSELRHSNGTKAAVLYMDSDFIDISKQGAIVTFNLVRENGSYVGYSEFQHMADLFNIAVRTGCFCNSGSCQRHLEASNDQMKEMYKAGHTCGDNIDLVEGKPTGAIRVSFGYYNTFNDVEKLMGMIQQCFVRVKFKSLKHIINSIKNFDSIKPISKLQIINDKDYFNMNYKETQNLLITNKNDTNAHKNCAVVLEEMAIYPIKSCGSFKCRSAWKLGPKGFEYDREWMIIKDNGVCLTQKQNTRMCMIKPKIDLKQKLLILNFKGYDPISVPLNPSESKNKNAHLCQSKVCTDVVQGYDCGDEVADWISNALETSFLRLVRQSSQDKRTQKKKGEENEKLLSLSNKAQYLLINKATVRWLHEKIKDKSFLDNIDELTDRFRGNLIVDTFEELVEKNWYGLTIGKHEFKVEGHCPRCQMICIDQKTGEKTVEPLRTISEQFAGKMYFGIYLSYVGPLDGSKDQILKKNAPIKPIIHSDHISR